MLGTQLGIKLASFPQVNKAKLLGLTASSSTAEQREDVSQPDLELDILSDQHDTLIFVQETSQRTAPAEQYDVQTQSGEAITPTASGQKAAVAFQFALRSVDHADELQSNVQVALATPEMSLSDAKEGAASALLTSYTSGKGGLGVVSDYNITVKFEGAWTAELQQRFVLAAEYLSTLITGDVRDKKGVDDIVITAALSDIDGVNGVLGAAGPTNFRWKGWLPTKGIMEFDVADAETFDSQGLFDDIVIHEMLHTLGFGTIWSMLGLTTGSIRNDNMRFTGENAKIAFKAFFPEIYADQPRWNKSIPIETDGGSGTAGGHWDEKTFANELMTGYIDDQNYVSALSVAALEDMGYDTIFNASNPTSAVPQPDDLLTFT